MKTLLLASTLFAALAASPASAQIYLGAGIGEAKTDVRKTSMKLYGGYQFDPTWGAEVAYTDLGDYRGANISSRSLAIVGTKAITDSWSILGKLGATSNHAKFTGASNKTDVLLGLGIGYSFSKNFGARLEYEDFGKLSKDTIGGDSRGRNLGLSVRYGF